MHWWRIILPPYICRYTIPVLMVASLHLRQHTNRHTLPLLIVVLTIVSCPAAGWGGVGGGWGRECWRDCFLGYAQRRYFLNFLVIAEAIDYNHKSVIQLIRDHPCMFNRMSPGSESKKAHRIMSLFVRLAEAQGFEPWIPCGMLVFKSSV